MKHFKTSMRLQYIALTAMVALCALAGSAKSFSVLGASYRKIPVR